ncbi:hypothetical protein FDP41_009666 [Naegleria fowleri]|uniref:Pyruvate kinase n=1 Tax=Naegleria fowleri TaxID=5763 RepID=A0A6A5BD15_NAEFO|nr:uncharacterized protein FDP41_009666 [Naegleria fowleri]KAF0971970.1 hypothetical protein FDP41_009666 [Naegleria fowleri]CAG4713244.1 unnamed protein product [Naegleria fowleri]
MSATTNQWARLSGAQVSSQLKIPQGDYARRTKIVATIGPKTQTVEMLSKLIRAGVNVIRMNFSHGSHDFHKQTVMNTRLAASQCDNAIVALMLDTKGPEIRTGLLEPEFCPDGIEVKTGQLIDFYCCQSTEEYATLKGKYLPQNEWLSNSSNEYDRLNELSLNAQRMVNSGTSSKQQQPPQQQPPQGGTMNSAAVVADQIFMAGSGTANTATTPSGGSSSSSLQLNNLITLSPNLPPISIPLDYKTMYRVVKQGDNVLIDDGLIATKVIECIPEKFLVRCIALNGGLIGEKKGCNLPGVIVDLPALTEKDIGDLKFAVQHNVDFIAASFIRKAEDVLAIRKCLGSRGQEIKIISKIENQEGLDNFDEILQVSDGIMVARGDMGVEIPLEQVTLAQKMIIAKCNIHGKPVITATQMLESMIKNPRPTRAEVTDIANAVFDGTDSVMLSGETAKGDYPVEAVSTMSRICVTSECLLDERKTFNMIREAVLELKGKISVTETIASSAVKTANDIQAGLIITITETGNTARLVSKYRPNPPCIAVTQNKATARQLMVSRNVFPVVVGSVIGTETVIARTIESAKEKKYVEEGQYVVVTSGHIEGVAGQTNILKVFTA